MSAGLKPVSRRSHPPSHCSRTPGTGSRRRSLGGCAVDRHRLGQVLPAQGEEDDPADGTPAHDRTSATGRRAQPAGQGSPSTRAVRRRVAIRGLPPDGVPAFGCPRRRCRGSGRLRARRPPQTASEVPTRTRRAAGLPVAGGGSATARPRPQGHPGAEARTQRSSKPGPRSYISTVPARWTVLRSGCDGSRRTVSRSWKNAMSPARPRPSR